MKNIFSRTFLFSPIIIIGLVFFSCVYNKPLEAAKKTKFVSLKNNEKKFIEAARDGEIEEVKEFLEKYKEKIDVCKSDRLTALHKSANKGHVEIVKFLIKKQANVNAKDNNNKTPLYFAFVKKHAEIAVLLISAGTIPKETATKDSNYMSLDNLLVLIVKNSPDSVKKRTEKSKNYAKAIEKIIKAGATIDKSIKKKLQSLFLKIKIAVSPKVIKKLIETFPNETSFHLVFLKNKLEELKKSLDLLKERLLSLSKKLLSLKKKLQELKTKLEKI